MTKDEKEPARTYSHWLEARDEADACLATDPDKAERIYLAGLTQFPDNAPLLGLYALFLYEVRDDYDGAEEYFERALAANPEHYANLADYARFLENVRKNYDRAEEIYKKLLELDAEGTIGLINYGLFLWYVRKDYDAVEALYENLREVDRYWPDSWYYYIDFIIDVRRDYDKAEKLYRELVGFNPEDPDAANRFAIFLAQVRGKHDEAELEYRRAVELAPKDAVIVANLAGHLLALGEKDEGLAYLERAFELGPDDISTLEFHFYRYAHDTDEGLRRDSLAEIKRLINAGVRSHGWDLSLNVARAATDGHPEPEFLASLAKVIAGDTDAGELRRFEVWRRA